MSQIIEEAFKELKSLKEETFSFDKQGALELQRFLDKGHKEPTTVDVVDPSAETEKDLKKDYGGEVILSCSICNGLTSKDPEDVVIDDETNLANVEEECPYCLNKGGYRIVAQIPGYDKNGDTIEDDEEYLEDEDGEEYLDVDGEEDLDIDVDDITVEEKEDLDESLNEADEYDGEDSDEDFEEDKEESYIVIYGNDPENFDETKDYYEIYDTEEEAIDSIDLEGTGYSYALVDTEEGSGEGRIFTSGDDGEVEEVIDEFEEESDESEDFEDEDFEEEDLTEAKDASDKDLWSEIYGKLTLDGEQTFSKGSTPRINRGVGYSNQEEVTTDRDGNIVVRCNSEEELEAAKEIVKAYRDKGVTSSTKYDRYMKRPYSLTIKIPEDMVGESLTEDEKEEVVVVLEPEDLDDLNASTLEIILSHDASGALMDSELRDQKEVNLELVSQPGRVYTYEVTGTDDDGRVKLRYVGIQETLTESIEDISVKTADDIINVKPSEDGKVTIETQPREIEAGALEPVAPEVQAEIEANTGEDEEEEETTVVDETEDTGDEDVDIEEFEEGDFDQLGEAYLKNIYDNVKSFKTTRGYVDNDKIKLEGLITFNSGKTVKTSFLFESYRITKRGKLKFLGENLQITPKKNSFILTGDLMNKKLVVESLTYNYTAKDASTGESKRVYGTVNKKK